MRRKSTCGCFMPPENFFLIQHAKLFHSLRHYKLKEMIDPNSVTNIELYQKVCIRYFGASERRILASDIQMGLSWNQNREGDQNRSGEA